MCGIVLIINTKRVKVQLTCIFTLSEKQDFYQINSDDKRKPVTRVEKRQIRLILV